MRLEREKGRKKKGEKEEKRGIYQFGFSEMRRDMQRRICTKEAAVWRIYFGE